MSIDTSKLMNLGDGQVLYNDLRNRIEQGVSAKSITESTPVAAFADGSKWAMELETGIVPVQDLHGYDHPWAGGDGANLIPMTVSGIKSMNTSGSWSGNDYTINNVTFNVVTDNGGNVVEIVANNQASADATIQLPLPSLSSGVEYIVSGCPEGGSSSKYRVTYYNSTTNSANDYGEGRSFTFASGNNEQIFCRILSGYNAQNVRFRPMIIPYTSSSYSFEPYTNICPISGWDAAVISVTGKNLLNTENVTDGIYIDKNGVVGSSNNYCLTDYIRISGTFTMSGYASVTYAASLGFYDVNKEFISGIEYYKTQDITCVPPEGAEYVRVSLRKSLMETQQMEYGTTATAYEPFGTETTVSFPVSAGTVYGGTLTVHADGTGTLVVDKGMITFDGTETFTAHNSGRWYKSGISADTNRQEESISNEFALLINGRNTYGYYFDVGSSGVYINKTSADETLAQLQARLSATNATIVYPLATASTYELTPGQINSLLGVNNVWSNTGNITSLKYVKDESTLADSVRGMVEAAKDETESRINSVEESIAIVVDGDTAGQNISAGQYVYVKNHSTLATGMYTASEAIASGGAVSGSNLTAESDGGLNSINGIISKFSDLKIGIQANSNSCSATLDSYYCYLIIAVSSADSHTGMWIVMAGSSTVYPFEVKNGSSITVSSSGMTITFTHSTSRTTRYVFLRLSEYHH